MSNNEPVVEEDGLVSMDGWIGERNRALMGLDLDWARRQYSFSVGGTADDMTLMAGMHKARYEVLDIPREQRHQSREWLVSRGYRRMLGQPWLPEGMLPGDE